MAVETPKDSKVMVKEMSWDPITRIVGSLGIHTEIDFTNQQVLKCYSTSMIFRGYDIFDHAIFNDCMANVDFCEQMVKETNPSLLAKAETTAAPGSDVHGYKSIADIMRALNQFTGDFYLETLQAARYTREMYCLFG